MYSATKLLSLAVALTLPLSVTAIPQGGQPCGAKASLCPDGMACHPDSDSCTDFNRCGGHCFFNSTVGARSYASCGGFRVDPSTCEDGFLCCDDPRDGHSCGMACDKPGICVHGDALLYESDLCPDGLRFYAYSSQFVSMEAKGVCL